MLGAKEMEREHENTTELAFGEKQYIMILLGSFHLFAHFIFRGIL